MKVIEIRRHSVRGAGPHLNQKGVELARRVGSGTNRPARVITSTLERAFETAIAMGFAVDEQLEILSTLGNDVNAEIFWDSPYAEFANKMRPGSALDRFAKELGALVVKIAAEISGNGRVLIVTYGGIVQTIAAVCLPPEENFSDLGGPPSYCEGIEIYYEGTKFSGYKILRVENA